MRRLLAPLAAAALALALTGQSAAALRITKVDTSGHPEVAVTVVAPRAGSQPPTLRENDEPVFGVAAQNLGRSKSVVVAIDRSRSMLGNSFTDAVEAARRFIGSKSPSDRIAVVGFGSGAVQLTRFSSATIDADGALRTLGVDRVEGTALYDAVALGSGLLAGEPAGARVLVVLTDGRDVSSEATEASAVAAAKRAGVAVYAIGIEGSQFSPGPLRALSGATGGSYRATDSTAALAGLYADIAAELRRTWTLRYYTAAQAGEQVRVQARLQGSTAEAVGLVPGRQAAAADSRSLLPTWLYDGRFAPFGVGLGVGLMLFLAVLLLVGAGKRSSLRRRLQPHVEQHTGGRNGGRPERFNATASLLTATEEAFGHLRIWLKVQKLIQRADLPLRAVEFFYISSGAAVALAALAFLLTRSPLGGLAGLGLGALVPLAVISLKARRRLKALENQLPDVLMTIAASLKAGHSFKQGLQSVVDEGRPPASLEFQRVLGETRLGRPMDAALVEMAERAGSKNLEFVVTAVTIQTQVGGSLAGLFDMVADAIRQRQQFQRKVKGLTAMGRASAYVLVGLPFILAGALTAMNPTYMSPLFHTSTGQKLLVLGVTMMAFGGLILKKIVSFRG